MSYQTETRALKRLSDLTWKTDDGDDFITMQGCFTPQGAKDLTSELGEEARDALGLVFIGNRTKAMMRKAPAEKLFALEGLPLNIQTAVRGR